MDNRLKILLITVIVLVVGGVATVVAVALTNSESSSSGTPKMGLETARFDFGNVSMANGLATKTLNFTNEGDSDLIISRIVSSCMCTTVKLKVGDDTSPAFGMPGHGGGAPLGWSETIPPGGSGTLEIVFDPNAHGPDAVGTITRTIQITSNSDGQSGNVDVITFDGNVIK